VRVQAEHAVSNLAQESEDILVSGRSDALEELLGFGFGSGLDEGEQFAEAVAFLLEDLISSPERGPATLALFGLVVAVGAQVLTAGTRGSVGGGGVKNAG
jgi:hypothetical protein